jgi:hypothetical protein
MPSYRVRVIIYDPEVGEDQPTAKTDEPLYSAGADIEAQAGRTYRQHISHLASEQ